MQGLSSAIPAESSPCSRNKQFFRSSFAFTDFEYNQFLNLDLDRYFRRSQVRSTLVARRKRMLSGLIWAVITGFIAGWLAGKAMKGGGYGVPMDIVLGIVGGVIGRFVFGLLGLSAWSVIGSIIVSFVGAVILIWLVRQLKKG